MQYLMRNKKVLFYDYGNFFGVAVALTRAFETVYVYQPYVLNGFPEHAPIDIGRNVPGIIKIKEYGNVLPDIDMVIFADCHEPEKMEMFERMGIKVFGARFGSDLENNRKLLKETLEKVGLPISKYQMAKGIDELSEKLKTTDHAYVKTGLRGDGETWEHTDYRLSKYEIDEMRAHLNVFQTEPVYLLDNHIDSIAEIGKDLFCIDGKYPEIVSASMERKDCCCIVKLMPYKDLPVQIKDVTDKLAPVFEQYNYKGWVSDEIIIGKDKKGYLCDLTCRLPAPPISVLSSMIKNFGECCYLTASGIVPILEYDNIWGVEIIIKSDIAENRASPMIIPKEFQDRVKIKNLVIDENGTWVFVNNKVPMKECGSVIGYGNTLGYAIESAEEIASSIKGLDIKIDSGALHKARKKIEELNSLGIKFM